MAYVQDKGTLVVGITEFEPMDYQNTDGEWIGFDADLASEFAESLGVSVEFQVIDWDNKVMELDGKTIDVVWNGMTLTEDVLAAMECSQPYLINQQVVVVPADVADQYQSRGQPGSAWPLPWRSAPLAVKWPSPTAITTRKWPTRPPPCWRLPPAPPTPLSSSSLMPGAMIGAGTSYAI